MDRQLEIGVILLRHACADYSSGFTCLLSTIVTRYGLSQFLPMGGSTCAIVGCGACHSRHKGLMQLSPNSEIWEE